jgi:hypothetical protein
MATTRATFRLQTVTPREYTTKDGETTKYSETWELFPVYSPDPNDENHTFWQASPGGLLRLEVTNPQAWGLMAVGQEYYLAFTLAE